MPLTAKIKNINYIAILDKIMIFSLYLYALGSHSSKSAISLGVGLVLLIWLLKIILLKGKGFLQKGHEDEGHEGHEGHEGYQGYEFKKPVPYWPFLLMLGLFLLSRNDISFIIGSRTQSQIILGVFFFLALINELGERKTIERLIYLTLAVVTISSAYAGYQYLYEGVRRAYGLARFSITLGNIAVMGAGVSLPFLFRKGNKIWQYLLFSGAFILNSAAVLFSLSRGSYLAWLGVMIIFFLLKSPKALPVFLIAVFLFYSFLPVTFQERFFSSFDQEESSFTTRVAMWRSSLEIMASRPLRGIGLDKFPENIPEEFDTEGFRDDHRHAHNNYFHFGAEAGIPALLLLLYSNYLIIKKLLLAYLSRKGEVEKGAPREKAREGDFYLTALLGLAGFLLAGLTVVNFIDFQSNHYFWFLAGAGLALIELDRESTAAAAGEKTEIE